MRVAILGVGRLGGSLLALLRSAGADVVGWRRGEPLPAADVYWLTVRDDALPAVAASLPASAVVLHASGASGPELLPQAERGVLHPLMTFPGLAAGVPDLHGVYARVAGTPRALAAAHSLAHTLGLVPLDVPGDTRAYHAAATMASAHVAATWLDATRVLTAAGVEPGVARAALLRLAVASLERAAELGPAALTGPAVRGDVTTLAAHEAVLPDVLLPAYRERTARIVTLRREG